jgi:hypothetical protein
MIMKSARQQYKMISDRELEFLFQDLCPNQKNLFLVKLKQLQTEKKDYCLEDLYEIQAIQY